MDAMALYECAIETVDYILYMILIECVLFSFVENSNSCGVFGGANN